MSSNAQRLAAAVLNRREQLGLTQLQVRDNGGPSNSTLTEIENAEIDKLTNLTARKLDEGLDWEKGSARNVWDGGEPTPLATRRGDVRDEAWLREQIERADAVPVLVRARVLTALDRALGEVRAG